jgi:hypothetical protein
MLPRKPLNEEKRSAPLEGIFPGTLSHSGSREEVIAP